MWSLEKKGGDIKETTYASNMIGMMHILVM